VKFLSLNVLLLIATAAFADGKPSPVSGMPSDWIPYATCWIEKGCAKEQPICGMELWGSPQSLQASDEETVQGGFVFSNANMLSETSMGPPIRDAVFQHPVQFAIHGAMIRTFQGVDTVLMFFSGTNPRFSADYIARTAHGDTHNEMSCVRHTDSN